MSTLYRDVALYQSKAQPEEINTIFEDARVMATMPVKAASHGHKHVAQNVVSVEGVADVELGGPLPKLTVEKNLLEFELGKLGGQLPVPIDNILKTTSGNPGSLKAKVTSYFNREMPMYMRAIMQEENKKVINTIKGEIIAAGKMKDMGGSNNANYHMSCVSWDSVANSGLYDDTMTPGAGNNFIHVMPLSGFQPYKDDNDVTVAGADIWTMFGLMLANSKKISGIANIDPEVPANFPLENDINEMIVSARATSTSSYIYMAPLLLTKLLVFKQSHMQMMPSNFGYDARIHAWNGIPIITDYNFLPGTEPNDII